MWSYIRAFTTKLRLWEGQLESGDYAHFPTLQENKPTSNTPFVSVIQNLRTKFLSRFGDIRSLENDIKLFCTPFDVQVDTVQEKYQMELVELHCSDELKSKFHAEGVLLLDFYKKISRMQTIPQLDQSCQKDGINVWQHLCVRTAVFVYESHQEQVENTT